MEMDRVTHTSVITQDEMRNVSQMFQSLKGLRSQITNMGSDETPTLEVAFQSYVTSVLNKLDKRLEDIDNLSMRRLEAILCLHGIYDLPFQHVIACVSTAAPHMLEPIKQIRSIHARLLADLQETAAGFIKSAGKLRSDLESQITSLEAKALNDKQDIENLKLSQMALNAEADDHTNQLLELQQQLREARDTINTLGGGIESTLQKKNKQQQQSPRNSSGSISIKGGTVSGVVNSEPSVMSFDESTSSMLASKSLRRTDSGSISSINRVGSSQWISAFRIAAQKSIDDNRSRPMLIKECRDFITRAYISRAAAVAESMEMHIYRSLETRFGLRTLAVESAGTLIISLEKLSEEDNDIAVFSKIFKNEIGEDFISVHDELSRSIDNLIQSRVIDKLPNKSSFDIKSELEVTEQDWTKIVKFLYNGSDSNALCVVLREVSQQSVIAKISVAGPTNSTENEKKRYGYLRTSPDVKTVKRDVISLPLKLFKKTVLDFQLMTHVSYFRDARITFQNTDADADGVLTADEFKTFFNNLRAKVVLNATKNSTVRSQRLSSTKGSSVISSKNGLTVVDVDMLDAVLSIADPSNSGRIPFTEAIVAITKSNAINSEFKSLTI